MLSDIGHLQGLVCGYPAPVAAGMQWSWACMGDMVSVGSSAFLTGLRVAHADCTLTDLLLNGVHQVDVVLGHQCDGLALSP